MFSFALVTRKEFKFCMDVINQTVEDYYPCLPCYACGYFCCFTTCGLSLFFPEPCTKQVPHVAICTCECACSLPSLRCESVVLCVAAGVELGNRAETTQQPRRVSLPGNRLEIPSRQALANIVARDLSSSLRVTSVNKEKKATREQYDCGGCILFREHAFVLV